MDFVGGDDGPDVDDEDDAETDPEGHGYWK
jgi:hypothetical protein